ncbi:MAG: threonine--tRNA ligase [Clostridia bacterium]
MKYINNNGEVYEGDYDVKIARHTTSHILAQAVKRLYPDAKLAIGPAIDTGFYYDFDNLIIKQEDLEIIENEMKKIIKENLKINSFKLSRIEAIKLMEENKENYKVELINDLEIHAELSFFKQGEYVDLCVGPHMLYLKSVGHFKLFSTTGAYWRGLEKNKMLTRIYGSTFEKREELDIEIIRREDVKKRDHNKLGRELEFFTTNDLIGQGLPIMLPKGAKVLQILQRFVEDVEAKHGWQLTKTPLMAKSDLYKLSGHWDHYKQDMFVLGDEKKDDEVFALRPMTCPFQYQAYLNRGRSYRDLPMRFDETSTLFRNESSGEMHGLIRVRQFTISEGHLMCTPDQLESEFKGCLQLAIYFLKVLGLYEDVSYRFSKWDPDDSQKYIGTKKQWDEAQGVMQVILEHLGLEYNVGIGEAAFYGPKLDIQIKNVYGKEDTLITIQIDQMLAESFGMEYVDKDGSKKRPYIIHRTSLGCYERTLALLIEKYAGALPLFIAPVQVKILPISENELNYAHDIKNILLNAGYRVEVDSNDEKIGYKIRQAQLEKVPYMIVLGKNEVENMNISLRSRSGEKFDGIKVDEFITKMNEEIQDTLNK